MAYKLKHNIVAEASVFERSGPTETLHTVPLGDEYVKVCIVVAMQPESPLYKPIVDECTTVGEAIGIPVAWPKEFVLYGTTNMVKFELDFMLLSVFFVVTNTTCQYLYK